MRRFNRMHRQDGRGGLEDGRRLLSVSGRLRIVAVLALAALTVGVVAAYGALGSRDTATGTARPLANSWAGTWSSNFGTMTLRQSGNLVEGNYTHDQGHLRGTVLGRVLSGKWDEAPTRAGSDAGDFEFTLSADGKSFTGRWRYSTAGAAWNTDWRGTCTGGACAGTPVGYKLLLWTTSPDGRVHSVATRINQVNRGPKAGLHLLTRLPDGSPPARFRIWFEQRPPGVPFGNQSLHNLVVCTNGLSTTRHCRIHSPGYPVSASSLQGFDIAPRRRDRTFIDLPITRFFRVTGRDSQGDIVVVSNTLRVTWTEAD